MSIRIWHIVLGLLLLVGVVVLVGAGTEVARTIRRAQQFGVATGVFPADVAAGKTITVYQRR